MALSKDFKPDWEGWDNIIAQIRAAPSFHTVMLTENDKQMLLKVDNYIKSHTIMDSLIWLGENRVGFKVRSITGKEMAIRPDEVAKYLEDPVDFEARRYSVSKQCFIAYQHEVARFSSEGYFTRHCEAKTKKGRQCKHYQTFKCQSMMRYCEQFYRKDFYCRIHQEMMAAGKPVEKFEE